MRVNVAVIIPAAGVGRRFGQQSKIEQDLAGRPVFLRSVECFANRPHIGVIILAVHPESLEEFTFRWGDKLNFLGVKVVAGGKAERWETVLKALAEVDESFTHVAVHDAARPLASAKLIERVLEAAQRYEAVIPAVAVSGTLKRVATVAEAQQADPLDAILGDAKQGPVVQRVVETVDRNHLVEVQTPQVFERGLLLRAYQQITAGQVDPATITDDAALVEALGVAVHVVEGEATNLKITRPDDMPLACAIDEAMRPRDAVAEARKRLFAHDDDE